MKTLSQLGLQLESERQRLKLDYQSLAEKTGLTPLSVRSVLQGKSAPRITTLMAIADQLGLEVLLLPKVMAAGLQAPAREGLAPAQSRVDRIVAETSAQYLASKTRKGKAPR